MRVSILFFTCLLLVALTLSDNAVESKKKKCKPRTTSIESLLALPTSSAESEPSNDSSGGSNAASDDVTTGASELGSSHDTSDSENSTSNSANNYDGSDSSGEKTVPTGTSTAKIDEAMLKGTPTPIGKSSGASETISDVYITSYGW